MKSYLVTALAVIIAVVITVAVMRRQQPPPSGPVPDLDAAAIQTSKNLHPPTLNQ